MTGKEAGIKAIRGRLLDASEVADILHMSGSWVRHKMATAAFPLRWFPLAGHARRIDSADLDDYLASIAVPAGKAKPTQKAARKISEEAQMKS
jgi:predicted DNA-binding transcriptional regulator AlpA